MRARAVQHSEASGDLDAAIIDDHAACEGHKKSQSSTSSTAHKVPHSSSKSGPAPEDLMSPSGRSSPPPSVRVAAPFAPSTPPQTTLASGGLTPGSATSLGRRSRLPPQLKGISNDPNQPSPTFQAGGRMQAQGRVHADPAAHVICLDTATQAYAVRKGVKNDGYRNSGGEVCAQL